VKHGIFSIARAISPEERLALAPASTAVDHVLMLYDEVGAIADPLAVHTKDGAHGLPPVVTPDQDRALWAPITRADLEKLDAVVKDKSLSLEEARAQAQAIKRKAPFSKAIMQVNPKLDTKQRRLQCSIRFGDFFHFLAPNAEALRHDKPMIWGVAMPVAFKSPPRRKN
jgi:hypothetical protein